MANRKLPGRTEPGLSRNRKEICPSFPKLDYSSLLSLSHSHSRFFIAHLSVDAAGAAIYNDVCQPDRVTCTELTLPPFCSYIIHLRDFLSAAPNLIFQQSNTNDRVEETLLCMPLGGYVRYVNCPLPLARIAASCPHL